MRGGTAARVLRLQGWYYLLGGLWPVLHLQSFEQVVGPKPDRFQTETTGALYAAIGVTLLAGHRSAASGVYRLVGGATAASSVAVVMRHRESLRAVCTADAALQAAFVAAAALGGPPPARRTA